MSAANDNLYCKRMTQESLRQVSSIPVDAFDFVEIHAIAGRATSRSMALRNQAKKSREVAQELREKSRQLRER